jgi:hypothetical protein
VESYFVKAQGHLDLHLGHESHRMDDAPSPRDTWMMNVSFGGMRVHLGGGY